MKQAENRPPEPPPRPASPVATPDNPAQRKPLPGPALPANLLFEEAGFETPAMPTEEQLAILKALAAEVSVCRKCPHLAETRTQTVFADGHPGARLMFIGEAPGADEDRIGLPFVGRAGQLLTDMITKGMGLRRQDVYIANILKCRPPENRDPTLEECANCLPYLERQIEILRPEFLCLLGRTAVSNLLGTTLSMGRLRGKWYRYRGIPTLVTYHPSYLLRNPAAKKEVWEDLQMLMIAMGLPIPSRRK
jgi:DNA polymerase